MEGRRELVEIYDTEEQVNDPNQISLNHHDDVNEGDLPQKIHIDHWWTAHMLCKGQRFGADAATDTAFIYGISSARP